MCLFDLRILAWDAEYGCSTVSLSLLNKSWKLVSLPQIQSVTKRVAVCLCQFMSFGYGERTPLGPGFFGQVKFCKTVWSSSSAVFGFPYDHTAVQLMIAHAEKG